MAVAAGAGMAHALLARLEAQGKLDSGLRYEIVAGELVIRGAPSIRHERIVSALMRHLTVWTHEHGGEVFAAAAVEIADHQLMPDVSFISPERVGELDDDGFHVPPDLVVEVTSPGTRSLDVVEKHQAYVDLGVGEHWVVDLAREVVVVHRRDEAGAVITTEHREGTLTTPAAPGLAVPVAELVAADSS